MNELKDWIRSARTYAKLTQDRLGEYLGKSKGNISQWESGAHEPSYRDLIKIIHKTKKPELPPGITPPCQAKQTKCFSNVDWEKIINLTERDMIRLETGLELVAKDLNLDILKENNKV